MKPVTHRFFVILAFLSVCLISNAAIEIHIKNNHPAVLYAGSELGKYLGTITGGAGKGYIEIGLFDDFAIGKVPAVTDRSLDDAVIVNVKAGKGFIAGSNPRSVLQGVYRFLWELGCRWVRPGKSGEIIPLEDAASMSVSLSEVASTRNRIICIEGATSLSNALDIIEWMPKVGFNGFMMQFRDGYTFFERWYMHGENPELKKAEKFDRAIAQEYTVLIEKELMSRGLLYHAIGHGWTTEAYGVPALGWIAAFNLPKDFTDHIALVNGHRTAPWNVPTLAALCYSNPDVQQKLTTCVVDYAQQHQNIDYLHVWLEDGNNGKCECENCRKKLPADFYFQILNKIDKELSARKLNTKIVFIAYNELLWRPIEERIGNTSRFSFMYANGRKDYSKALDIADKNVPLLPFQLNHMPSNSNENKYVTAYLNDWTKYYPGDRMLFEYYGGAQTVKLARTVSQDIRNFDQFGLNGLVNCQSLRVFFPDGLGMVVMGRTLWNNKLSFDEIANDYFVKAYGEDGKACLNFMSETQQAMETITAMFKDSVTAKVEIEKLKSMVTRFQPVVNRNINKGSESQSISWDMVQKYLTILDYYIQFAQYKIQANGQGLAYLVMHRFQQYIFSVEAQYQPYLEARGYFEGIMR